jgi:hypothetical protein
VLSIVDTVTDGSDQGIKALGFDVRTRMVVPDTNAAPENLREIVSKAGVLTLRWKGVRGQKGYSLQMGDGSAAGNWGPVIDLTRARFNPVGLMPGQHVAFRVQVHRKSGPSAWSDVLTFDVP